MAELKIISGAGGKLPAAFLLETCGRRILFDLGEGPEPGVLPDVAGIHPVDALCLSHAHQDHAGALQLRARLGRPPVYATAETFAQIPEAVLPQAARHLLPLAGTAEVAGLTLTTGRSGHAPGGIWLHVAADCGFLYMGDWTPESGLLAFDPPPRAACLVTDASYGDRDTSLADQTGQMAEAVRGGAVLPVPSAGRGPEVVLALAREGLKPRACPVVLAEMTALARTPSGICHPGTREELTDLLASAGRSGAYQPTDVIVSTEANAETGLAASLLARAGEGFRFVFSSHVPPGTPAADLLAQGQAEWLGWNVHPRLKDTLWLADHTRACHVVPAFAAPEAMPKLTAALGKRLHTGRSLIFGPELDLQLGPVQPVRRSI